MFGVEVKDIIGFVFVGQVEVEYFIVLELVDEDGFKWFWYVKGFFIYFFYIQFEMIGQVVCDWVIVVCYLKVFVFVGFVLGQVVGVVYQVFEWFGEMG